MKNLQLKKLQLAIEELKEVHFKKGLITRRIIPLHSDGKTTRWKDVGRVFNMKTCKKIYHNDCVKSLRLAKDLDLYKYFLYCPSCKTVVNYL